MFVKHRCPRRQQSHNMAKLVLHFDPAPPPGCGKSVKCEEPIDEPTVPVWLLNHHPNFKYFTLYTGRNYGQADGRTIQLLDAPGGPSRPEHKNYGSGLYECIITRSWRPNHDSWVSLSCRC